MRIDSTRQGDRPLVKAADGNFVPGVSGSRLPRSAKGLKSARAGSTGIRTFVPARRAIPRSS